MLLKKIIAFTFIATIAFANNASSQNCIVSELPFNAGERVEYAVYYHWNFVWVNAGIGVFSVNNASYAGKNVLQLTGQGYTTKRWDLFYKVRDRYDSWVDKESLKPYRYLRNTIEGPNVTYNDNYFKYQQKKITYYGYDNKTKMHKDSTSLVNCVFDVMTMIYYARTIDFSNAKKDDTYPINLYLDGKVYSDLYLRYIGKEKIKTTLGEFNCIVFKPKLIAGTIFKGGEGMTVYVSDDAYHIPILIKTDIAVGEIQVKVTNIKK